MSMPPDDQPQTRTRLPAGEQPGAQPPRSPLRSLAMVLGVVAVLIAVIAVVNWTRGTPDGTGSATARSGGSAGGSASSAGSPAGASAQPTAPTGVKPVTGSSDGIAAGFPQTSEGAQSAAANDTVALGSSGMYADATRQKIVDAVTDPAATQALRKQLDPSFQAQARSLGLTDGRAPQGLTFVCRPVPVGTKLDSYGGGRATVEVWTTGLVGLAGQGSTDPVTDYWFTLTLRLHWTGGDWKVASYSQVQGPAPVNGGQQAADAGTIAGAANTFGGFTYAR